MLLGLYPDANSRHPVVYTVQCCAVHRLTDLCLPRPYTCALLLCSSPRGEIFLALSPLCFCPRGDDHLVDPHHICLHSRRMFTNPIIAMYPSIYMVLKDWRPHRHLTRSPRSANSKSACYGHVAGGDNLSASYRDSAPSPRLPATIKLNHRNWRRLGTKPRRGLSPRGRS